MITGSVIMMIAFDPSRIRWVVNYRGAMLIHFYDPDAQITCDLYVESDEQFGWTDFGTENTNGAANRLLWTL